MPVYLLHGFRWPRGGFTGIRVHIIVNNLDDCSADYIQNPRSQAELLKSFRKQYPELMKSLEPSTPMGTGKGGSGIQFLEQYDPEDEMGENAISQPYAYVADKVVTLAGGSSATHTVAAAAAAVAPPGTSVPPPSPGAAMVPPTSDRPKPVSASKSTKGSVSAGKAAAAANKMSALSLNVEEVVAEGSGVGAAAWEALAELRDKIAAGEKIGWWVVYNGDPERAYDSSDVEDEDAYGEGGDEEDENEDEDGLEEILQKQGEYSKGRRITREQRDQALPAPPRSPPPPIPRQNSQPPLPNRTRPPQPTPKSHIFETSDALSPSQPQPSFPTSKNSGKRLPGMRAATTTPIVNSTTPTSAYPSQFQQQRRPEPNHEHQQQQQQSHHPNDPTRATTAATTATEQGQRSTTTGPKSDSFKKLKLFGKRG